MGNNNNKKDKSCRHDWRLIDTNEDTEKEAYFCTRCLAGADAWFDEEGYRRVEVYPVQEEDE